MTIREKIILDIKEIGNPALLQQLFEFLEFLKREFRPHLVRSNKDQVLQFAGALEDEEAEQIRADLDQEFNHIEGAWYSWREFNHEPPRQ